MTSAYFAFVYLSGVSRGFTEFSTTLEMESRAAAELRQEEWTKLWSPSPPHLKYDKQDKYDKYDNYMHTFTYCTYSAYYVYEYVEYVKYVKYV